MVTTEHEPRRTLQTAIDEGFPARTTRTSMLVAVIASALLFTWEGRVAGAGLAQHAISIGFACGAAINLVAVGLLMWAVASVIRKPEEGRPRRPGLLVATLILQLPFLALALYGSVKVLQVNVFALAAGLGIWFFVAVLKVASILLLGGAPRK